jgi:hypothetical protein
VNSVLKGFLAQTEVARTCAPEVRGFCSSHQEKPRTLQKQVRATCLLTLIGDACA